MYKDDFENTPKIQDTAEAAQGKKEDENTTSSTQPQPLKDSAQVHPEHSGTDPYPPVYRNHQQNTPKNTQQPPYGNAQQTPYGNTAQNSYGSGPQNTYGNYTQNTYGNAQHYGNTQQNGYGSNPQPSLGSTSGYNQPNNTNSSGYSQPNNTNSSGYNQPNNTNYTSSNNSNYGQHYAPWQQPQDPFSSGSSKNHAKKPFPPLLKKTTGIVAAALLFGVVAGTTMSGIGLLVDRVNPAANQEPVTLSQAETLPAPQTNSEGSSAAVITTGTNDVSAIVERAMPSVVAINSVTQHEIQNWFGQSQIYEGRGSGSGIIVGESDTELLIVTNNHVIEGANSLSVSFSDNESAEAHIKGTDSENDLAVLAISLEDISDDTKSKIAIATLGDSDSLKVGQGVIAIGNALGYGQSVTVGYVSALDREVNTDEETTRNLLQTDAAINPGNSGGALLNMQGEVIGINSAKYSSTDVEGMGYAIPISKVRNIIDNLMTMKTRVQIEQARQGYLGIQGTDIDSNTANLYGMPQGVFVYKIMEDGAAASSDLKEKDIITKFDGQTIKTMSELKNMLLYYAGGDSVELTVQSLQDGQYVERQVVITLGTRPKEEGVN